VLWQIKVSKASEDRSDVIAITRCYAGTKKSGNVWFGKSWNNTAGVCGNCKSGNFIGISLCE